MENLLEHSEVPDTVVIRDAKTYIDMVLEIEDRPYDVVVLFNLMPDD